MSSFYKNIISIHGEKGKAWLAELPELVSAISSKLNLSDLKEVNNLTYNYVLSGFQDNRPVILKLVFDKEVLKREAFAIKCFAECGAVKVYVADDGLLLLKRAVPGISLKSYFLGNELESINIFYGLMKKLHQAKIPPTHIFPHIKDWLAVLDKDWPIPNKYLLKSRKLRYNLLETAANEVLLHGDLHHDNILSNGNDWLVIDPKGVIGEPAYEAAAFIRNPMPELLSVHNHVDIIQKRIAMLAKLLKIPTKRIFDWCFVQAVLSWVWALEDAGDVIYFEQLTKIFDNGCNDYVGSKK